MSAEFGPDENLVRKVQSLEAQLRDLQTVVLILVSQVDTPEPGQVQRLAEMIYKNR